MKMTETKTQSTTR